MSGPDMARRTKSKADPKTRDTAPTSKTVTTYDERHFVTYVRLLDAAEEGADWREVARIVLEVDPDKEPARAERMYQSHLKRARWLTAQGYRDLLRKSGSG